MPKPKEYKTRKLAQGLTRIKFLVKAVREEIDKRGTTTMQLAKETGMPYFTLRSLFTGRHLPKGDDTLRLLEWLTGRKTAELIAERK